MRIRPCKRAWHVLLLVGLFGYPARPSLSTSAAHGALQRSYDRIAARRRIAGWSANCIRPTPRAPIVQRRQSDCKFETPIEASSGPRKQPRCPKCGMELMTMRLNLANKGKFWLCTRCYETLSCVALTSALDVDAPDKIEPRGYQELAVESIRAAFDKMNKVACCLATGAGKTSVANAYITKYASDKRVLWVAPAIELLEQAHEGLLRHNGCAKQFRVGRFSPLQLQQCPETLDSSDPGAVAYVSLHKLYGMLKHEALAQEYPMPELIVWDEFHWAETTVMGQLLMKWAQRCGIPFLGLTATPRFIEGVEIRKRAQASGFEIVFALSLLRLARWGWLAWPRFWAWDNDNPMDAQAESGTIHCERQFPRARRPASTTEVVSYFLGNKQRCGKTLVKASSVLTAEELVSKFREEGVDARPIHYKMTDESRSENLEWFRMSRTTDKPSVLVVVQMGVKGLDIPDLQTIFLTHKIGSETAYMQLCGRGARIPQGSDKTHFNIVEFHPDLHARREILLAEKDWHESKWWKQSDIKRACVKEQP